MRSWRLFGAALLAGAYLPLHRLLTPERGSVAASATRAQAEGLLLESWSGTAIAIALSALGVLFVGLRARFGERRDEGRTHRWETATARGLTAVSAQLWAVGCAVVAGGAALLVHRFVLLGRPTLADEFVQLRHARLLATGRLGDGWAFDPAFRNSVNGLWSPEGWTSIYPPGHTSILALFSRLGLEGWVGPLLTGATAGFTAALVLRLLDERPTTARVATMAAALSPFLWGIGAGYLSHTSAACGIAIALWAAVRARDGSAKWALVTGVAAGMAVSARPWSALVPAVVLPVAIWATRAIRESRRPPALHLHLHREDDPQPPPAFDRRAVGVRAVLATVGGLPFLIALAWWNHRLFGSPLRFGYEAAFGPSHRPGLHPDPWGNLYGVREAIGHTGADLVLLGRHLFETPVPAVAAIGGWLLLRGRPFRGSGILFAWAGTAVVTNALYWHHGIHMGPRMLYEAAPAWAVLTVLAAIGLGLPRGTLAPPSDDTPELRHPALGAVVALARVTTVVSLGWALALGLPARLGSWVLPPAEALPALGSEPTLVFVHGSWAGREAARLEASGMRRDSVETALRRNDLCRVHEYARARRTGGPLPRLDLEARAGSPDHLALLELSEGNRVRIDPAAEWSPSCHREAEADREGTIELATVLARANTQRADRQVVWVRDLGPAENATLLETFPRHAAHLWVAGSFEPYDAAVGRLWSDD